MNISSSYTQLNVTSSPMTTGPRDTAPAISAGHLLPKQALRRLVLRDSSRTCIMNTIPPLEIQYETNLRCTAPQPCLCSCQLSKLAPKCLRTIVSTLLLSYLLCLASSSSRRWVVPSRSMAGNSRLRYASPHPCLSQLMSGKPGS